MANPGPVVFKFEGGAVGLDVALGAHLLRLPAFIRDRLDANGLGVILSFPRSGVGTHTAGVVGCGMDSHGEPWELGEM